MRYKKGEREYKIKRFMKKRIFLAKIRGRERSYYIRISI